MIKEALKVFIILIFVYFQMHIVTSVLSFYLVYLKQSFCSAALQILKIHLQMSDCRGEAGVAADIFFVCSV